MGSGCSSKSKVERSLVLSPRAAGTTAQEPLPPLQGQLAPVVNAVGKANSLSESKVDEIIRVLASVPSGDASVWLAHWLSRAPSKSRAGLLVLMQRVLTRALDANVVLAEELVASEESNDAAEGLDLARMASLCEDTIRLDDEHRQAVLTAVLVLDGAAGTAGEAREQGSVAYDVPVLDRLVLLFRGALAAHSGGAARILQQWREFEESVGLPPLEVHLALLSASAKAVLLGLRLVPDGAPPATVIVRREHALLDAAPQLPQDHASVLLPYFKTSAGSKVVKGKRVEGGEGHGPRKEFFAAASTDALRRWGDAEVAPPNGCPAAAVGVLCSGSSVMLGNADGEEGAAAAEADGGLRRCLARARVGDKLRLEFTDGTEAERVVTAIRTGDEPALLVREPFEGPPSGAPVVAGRCELQRPVLPLFEFHRGTGQNWFSAYADELNGPQGQELRTRFHSFGKLLALAVVNGCKISFSLPVLFFRVLLRRGAQPALADLQGFDNVLHASLKKCLKMKQAQFASLKEVEALPAEMSREEYVAEQVRSILSPKAMEEVRNGFWSLASEDLLRGVTASELRQMVCPTDSHQKSIDIRHVFKVSMEEEMAECALFVDAFWAVLDGLTLEEKRLFLLFLTGVEVPPEPGVERLHIELPFSAFSREEHLAMLKMLPQAHTCTNTLELPNYHDALLESGTVAEEQGPEVLATELRRLLGEKLRLAINESAGYELDAISVRGEEHDAAQPVSTIASLEPIRLPELVNPSQPGKWRGAGANSEAALDAHPGLRREDQPSRMEVRPSPRLPALAPLPKAPRLEWEVAAARDEGLAAVERAKVDVDSLLQDCGLLSLLSEEQQLSPRDMEAASSQADSGRQFSDLE